MSNQNEINLIQSERNPTKMSNFFCLSNFLFPLLHFCGGLTMLCGGLCRCGAKCLQIKVITSIEVRRTVKEI